MRDHFAVIVGRFIRRSLPKRIYPLRTWKKQFHDADVRREGFADKGLDGPCVFRIAQITNGQPRFNIVPSATIFVESDKWFRKCELRLPSAVDGDDLIIVISPRIDNWWSTCFLRRRRQRARIVRGRAGEDGHARLVVAGQRAGLARRQRVDGARDRAPSLFHRRRRDRPPDDHSLAVRCASMALLIAQTVVHAAFSAEVHLRRGQSR